MNNHRSRFLGVTLAYEENAEVEYVLRVETSHGTMWLPGTVTGDGKIVFNWIVFEEDTVVHSTQLFRRMLDPEGDIIDEHSVTERVVLGPGDNMHLIPPHECGCFIEPLPD